MQRLEVLIAGMLARERRSPADAAAAGCTALAAALAALPSRPLEMVAEAVAALGFQLDVERPSGAARNLLQSKRRTRAPQDKETPDPKSTSVSLSVLFLESATSGEIPDAADRSRLVKAGKVDCLAMIRKGELGYWTSDPAGPRREHAPGDQQAAAS